MPGGMSSGDGLSTCKGRLAAVGSNSTSTPVVEVVAQVQVSVGIRSLAMAGAETQVELAVAVAVERPTCPGMSLVAVEDLVIAVAVATRSARYSRSSESKASPRRWPQTNAPSVVAELPVSRLEVTAPSRSTICRTRIPLASARGRWSCCST